MSTSTSRGPEHCENCGKQLYRTRLGNQCLFCGHHTESVSTQFTQRAIHFLIANTLVWLAIAVGFARLSVGIGIIITACTAFCLFGGLILRRWLSMKGDWIAVGLTAVMVFMFLHVIGPG